MFVVSEASGRLMLSCIAVLRLLLPLLTSGGGGELPGPGGAEGSPGPDCVAYVFVVLGGIIICRLYKLTLPGQAQATLQVTVSLSDLVKRDLDGPLLLGGGGGPKRHFHRGPNPLSAAVVPPVCVGGPGLHFGT
jgi:hypothetical protein